MGNINKTASASVRNSLRWAEIRWCYTDGRSGSHTSLQLVMASEAGSLNGEPTGNDPERGADGKNPGPWSWEPGMADRLRSKPCQAGMLIRGELKHTHVQSTTASL